MATVNKYGRITGVGVGNCTVTVSSADNPNAFANVSVTVTPYIAPIEPEITYINGILIANKTYPLPSTYNPGVDPVANAALQEMFAAAKEQGLNLFVRSGFRSYLTQKTLYNNYVKRDGVAAADRYSARPGHSEHQTGLAFDINKANASFAGSPEANWLAENCYKYGFIIRYPQGKEAVTGYMYEPWHIRYLGIEIATAVYNSGLCLEEYLGITSIYQ
ncbi:MAG: D-alanyl-D-alanine carboxypeptidase family protein [Ruminococcaceae bacterium]|nr:D-alanyl-D-alanine carboxypeptidase family protein [Oscillospiraceae bacterium]